MRYSLTPLSLVVDILLSVILRLKALNYTRGSGIGHIGEPETGSNSCEAIQQTIDFDSLFNWLLSPSMRAEAENFGNPIISHKDFDQMQQIIKTTINTHGLYMIVIIIGLYFGVISYIPSHNDEIILEAVP